MSGDTEQKNLPASQRKLRKARERGEVASSSDFANALSLIAGLVMMAVYWTDYVQLFTGSLRLGIDAMRRPSASGTLGTGLDVLTLAGRTMLPLLIVVAFAGLLGHVAHKKGFVFSAHPITPNFARLNPAQGFARFFSARNGAEFLIALLRCTLWLGTSALITWLALPRLIMSPTCALPCVAATGTDLMTNLLIAAILFVIVLGLLDLPFQVFMFLREQRMSRTEAKRESKEMEGAPEFVGYRRGQHREYATGPAGGMRAASLIFMSSGEAVAVQYDPDVRPVPMILAKGVGPNADVILTAAQALGTPIEIDPRLAAALAQLPVGALVPEREFNAVAAALVRHGKVG